MNSYNNYPIQQAMEFTMLIYKQIRQHNLEVRKHKSLEKKLHLEQKQERELGENYPEYAFRRNIGR